MWLRLIFFTIVIVVLAGVAAVYVQPGLVSAISGGAPIVAVPDSNRLSFTQSVNDLGDRIYLTTNAGITLTPQPSGPDKVTISPSSLAGAKPGTFRFTIVPHQGSRGTRRAVGEFETTGQVFRLCEVVDDPAGGQAPRAERSAPVNNAGNRYMLPVPMQAGPYVQLINSAIGGTPAGSNNRTFAPSAETQRLAQMLVGLCGG